ncbi:MAG: methenyltetrahydrofolate cyclohydrolase [Gammaproteobacteria bacterium]|nr:methenyltetrahydrofolate cyclohydrolase [Gammaproteobacteria bacterium]
MSIDQHGLEQFLDALASRAPTPGGGSAASLMGAMGAALVAMVCQLTTGKGKYAGVEHEIQECLAQAEALRAQVTATHAQDIAAFDAVMAAYGLPRASDEEKAARGDAIQRALGVATEVPLRCARLCAEVLQVSGTVAKIGNLTVISDAGVAAMAAYAGLKSAALNVYINVPNLTDRTLADRSQREIEQLTAAADRAVVEIYQFVRGKV